MAGREKLMIVGLALLLAGLIIMFFEVLPVLSTHLTAMQWLQLALAGISALLVILDLYLKAGRGLPCGWREAFAVTFV